MTNLKVNSRVRCLSKAEEDPVEIGDVGTALEVSCGVVKVLWDVPRIGMYRAAGNVYSMIEQELEEI